MKTIGSFNYLCLKKIHYEHKNRRSKASIKKESEKKEIKIQVFFVGNYKLCDKCI